MTTAKTTPTENYSEAGAEQAKGKAKVDHASSGGETVEGKQLKAEGVADAQQEPNIAINDVTNISE